jgi:hypothetical protein
MTQSKRANGQIFSAIKKCLFDQKKGKWADELSRVIWSHNTTESRATKFTPFRLLYGAEAMCLEELANESAKVLMGSSRENEEVDKDLVEIDRLDVVANLLKYQEDTRMEKQEGFFEEHSSRRHCLQRKKERRLSRQIAIRMGRALYCRAQCYRRSLSSQERGSVELLHSWNVYNLSKFSP